jgi:hypothetical protein
MKKQLLIAAVAATMATVSIADVSITGGAKINFTNTDTTNADSVNQFNHDIDFTLAGKNGDTSVSVTVANETTGATTTTDTKFDVENAFVASKVMGANVKVGQWAGADSNMANGTRSAGKFSADYTLEGVKVQFEDQSTGSKSITLSGSVAGVAVSHEMFQNDDTDTTVSGSFGGVNAKYRSIQDDSDSTNGDKRSFALSTEVNGITLSYNDVDVKGTGQTSSDDWFGTFGGTCTTTSEVANTCFNEASGFGVSTALAGNTVTLKSYDIKEISTATDDSYTKVVVNRPLAGGATFEMTYTDKDDAAGTDVETLDLELAVKF